MKREIDSLIALDSGDDPWGHTLEHLFGICETLYANGESVPASFGFRDPWPPEHRLEVMQQEWPDAEYLELYRSGAVSADDLRHAARVLDRHARNLQRLGLDY